MRKSEGVNTVAYYLFFLNRVSLLQDLTVEQYDRDRGKKGVAVHSK